MKWVLIAVFLVAITTPARAQIVPSSCAFYFADSEYMPPEAEELLESGSRAALEVCANPSGKTYTYVSAPVSGAFGVCRLTKRELFKDGDIWTFTPPVDLSYLGDRRALMMISDDVCPRQDDQQYIPANDVTEGTFVALVQFWEDVSSRRDYDVLFTRVFPDVRSSPILQEFEKAIRSEAELEVAEVGLYRADEQAMAYYEIELGRPLPSWVLIVDFVGNEVMVLGAGAIEY